MLNDKQISSRVYRMFKSVRKQLDAAGVVCWKPKRKRWMSCGDAAYGNAGWNIRVTFAPGMVPVFSMLVIHPETYKNEYFGYNGHLPISPSFEQGIARLIELYGVKTKGQQ